MIAWKDESRRSFACSFSWPPKRRIAEVVRSCPRRRTRRRTKPWRSTGRASNSLTSRKSWIFQREPSAAGSVPIKGRRKSERSGKKKPNARKRGGQPGNKNATGPPGNKHAEKFGFFSRYLPEETLELVGLTADSSPLDLLWAQIQLAFAAIVRAQKIAYVKDQNDKTIEKVEEKDGNVIGERWEVQEAW